MSETTTTTTQTVQRRTRKTHHKVRTGCLTCKIRRKKCDETKPHCQRCTNTGRVCDGYDDQLLPSRGARAHIPKQTYQSREEGHFPPLHDYFDVANMIHHAIISVDQEEWRLDHEQLNPEFSSLGCGSLAKSGTSFWVTPTSSNITTPPFAPHQRVIELEYASSNSDDTSPSNSNDDPFRQTQLTKDSCMVIIKNPSSFTLSFQPSDLQSHCFSFFRCRTGPEFACHLNSLIWCPNGIHSALTHPTLFRAAVALGAVHRRFNYGISREALEYCGHAARFYDDAVKSLREIEMRSAGTELTQRALNEENDNRGVLMTSELLLGLFQIFQGEPDKAVVHMCKALRYLFGLRMRLVHTESRSHPRRITRNTFYHLLAHLRPQVTQLLDSPTLILVEPHDEPPAMPDKFQNFEEARDFLFTIIDGVEYLSLGSTGDVDERRTRCTLYVSRLVQWRVAYAETAYGIERTAQQKRACTLMGLMRTTTHLMLQHMLSNDHYFDQATTMSARFDGLPQSKLDEICQSGSGQDNAWNSRNFDTDLARLHVLVANVSDEDGLFNYHDHSLGIRSTRAPQQEPVAASTDHAGSTNCWRPEYDVVSSGFGVLGIVGRVKNIGAKLLARSVSHMIPAHVRPESVDMSFLVEDRKVLLRYSYPDEQETTTIWTQQWWAF